MYLDHLVFVILNQKAKISLLIIRLEYPNKNKIG